MKIIKLIRENRFILLLTAFVAVNIAVNIRINVFRYNNFDFGKFDLGNMSQMLWNTMHGNFMYLTDYFGTNLPRWAMSHVDPILLLFLPLFAVFQHPLTLVISQFVILILAAFLVYKIAYLRLGSKAASAMLGVAYLLYPALGYLNAWTGFHGVTAAVPFFFGAFYVFEKMYKEKNFSKKNLIIFWVLLIITMAGKEQLPLYVVMYSLFILFFRPLKEEGKKFYQTVTGKLALSMFAVATVWFITAFFIIIPAYSQYRVAGYNKFAREIGIAGDTTRDVSKPNYFLSRYDAFGESYTDVLVGMVMDHQKAIRIFFGGDRIDNLRKTFDPVLFLPLAYPQILLVAAPDFLINYLTSADGVGTAEITNHRISMIIPVLFISSIYAIGMLADTLGNFKKRRPRVIKGVQIFFGLAMVIAGIHTSYVFNNPVYLWIDQAVRKRVLAESDPDAVWKSKLKVGDVVKLPDLDNKDVECAEKIVGLIPDGASVTGPDYLGAHLSLRETYAIFPALYTSADYVIVDVFSRKILTILDVETSLVRDVTADIIKSKDYELLTGCGNLFVFKKVGVHEKTDLLPMQEKFSYTAKYAYDILFGTEIADFDYPKEATRGVAENFRLVFFKRESDSLNGFVMYMTFMNDKTGKLYEIANLPSFSLIQPADWDSDRYYVEDLNVNFPSFLEPGDYRVFVGMSNKVKTRNLYLGNILIK
ncbi:hypothetical protein A3K01_02745 [candidate division WWE3 bacterium RIFOXYD1_FULL_43_17]|uniref:DUF2079 domain-containing protein n=2 Tax=Katanobacteria TaxID=422282 RepID=A0A1F4XEX5_UNCKA|nr:MAG: hypothetical protein A3K01_02745 [candidate division WWE3 bacterium RIFOXYD1_FULL_43_17]